MKHFFKSLQDYYILTFKGLQGLVQGPFYFRDTIDQMANSGPNTTIIVIIIALFAGMALTVQVYNQFTYLGLEEQIGKVVATSLIREIGPITIALIYSGKVGTGIAAELASMVQRHEIDAYRAFSVNPIKKVVTPRILSGLLMLPGLTLIGDFSGLLGGFYITSIDHYIVPSIYWKSVFNILQLKYMVVGIVKPIVFGFIISSISCYLGINARGGSIEIKAASTRSFVMSSVFIMVWDFLLTRIFSFILPSIPI